MKKNKDFLTKLFYCCLIPFRFILKIMKISFIYVWEKIKISSKWIWKTIINTRNTYLIFGLLSILFICVYFIDKDNPLCIVSCGIGTSGIGAVLLAFFIERNNYILNEKNNQKLFKNANIDIAKKINELLTIFNRIIIEVNIICDEDYKFIIKKSSISLYFLKLLQNKREITFCVVISFC